MSGDPLIDFMIHCVSRSKVCFGAAVDCAIPNAHTLRWVHTGIALTVALQNQSTVPVSFTS
jgi:hypothetical protein